MSLCFTLLRPSLLSLLQIFHACKVRRTTKNCVGKETKNAGKTKQTSVAMKLFLKHLLVDDEREGRVGKKKRPQKNEAQLAQHRHLLKKSQNATRGGIQCRQYLPLWKRSRPCQTWMRLSKTFTIRFKLIPEHKSTDFPEEEVSARIDSDSFSYPWLHNSYCSPNQQFCVSTQCTCCHSPWNVHPKNEQ